MAQLGRIIEFAKKIQDSSEMSCCGKTDLLLRMDWSPLHDIEPCIRCTADGAIETVLDKRDCFK